MAGAAPPISFRFAPVAPGLEQVALIHWEVATTVDQPVIDQLHPDYANMRFMLAGDWAYGSTRSRLSPVTDFATVTGPTSQGQWARVQQGHGFNVTLLPLAWLRLFRGGAKPWHNRLGLLSELIGEEEESALSAAMRVAASRSRPGGSCCSPAWGRFSSRCRSSSMPGAPSTCPP